MKSVISNRKSGFIECDGVEQTSTESAIAAAREAYVALCRSIEFYPPLSRLRQHPLRWIRRKLAGKSEAARLGDLHRHALEYSDACLAAIFEEGLYGTADTFDDSRLTGPEVLKDRLAASIAFTLRRYIEHGGPVPDLLSPKTFSEKLIIQKYFGRVPLPSPEDKLLAAQVYLPKNVKDLVCPLERPFTAACPSIPENGAVPEGHYFWKANHANGLFRRVSFPADEEMRATMLDDAKRWLNDDGNERQGQWWNTLIERKVYLEKDLSVGGHEAKDWKMFVMGAQVCLIQVDTGRQSTHDQVAYDRNFNKLDRALYFDGNQDHERPKRLADMITIAEAIGRHFDFCRIDLYYVEEQIYLGEITIIPVSALRPPINRKLDKTLGDLWPEGTIAQQSLNVVASRI